MIVCCLKKLNDNGNCAISMAKSEYFTCHVGPLCLHGPPFLTPAKRICIFFSGKLFFLFSPRCKAYLTSMPSINGRKWIKPYLIQYFSFLLVPKRFTEKEDIVLLSLGMQMERFQLVFGFGCFMGSRGCQNLSWFIKGRGKYMLMFLIYVFI